MKFKTPLRFTLLELVVVLAIMSIIMLVTIPMAVKPGANTLESVLRQVSVLLEAARTVAMRDGTNTTVTINLYDKVFSTDAKVQSSLVVALGNVQQPATVTEVKLPETFFIRAAKTRQESLLPPVRGMKAEQTEDKIVFEFRSDGTGMMPEIEIEDQYMNRATISVMPLTGKIHIEEERRR